MFLNSNTLALIFVAFLPLILLIILFVSRRLQKLSLKTQTAFGHMTHLTKESLEGYQLIRSTQQTKMCETEKFRIITETIRQQQVDITITNSIGVSLARISAAIALSIAIYLATLPHIGISAGAFISAISAMLTCLRPLRSVTEINSALQKGIAGAKSIFDILDAEAENETGLLLPKEVTGNIVFQEICFHYPKTEHFHLQQVNFAIPAHQTTLITGISGSGKSTLMHLLLRYYAPLSGRILLDGIDIAAISLTTLRSQFSLVSDRAILFNDTIRNNIAYGCPDTVTDQAITDAAHIAEAYDFIHALPHQFETVIGDNGTFLSSGQKQCIAIARACLQTTPILILDEAFSTIDRETSNKIFDNLRRSQPDRTIILIAHQAEWRTKVEQVLSLNNPEDADTKLDLR